MTAAGAVPLMQVDAFAGRRFGGNPAAVCWLEAPREESRNERWMQAVAAEMNLSETAFVSPRTDGEFGLRWFTPAVEVNLCGHATLATAHALWEWGRLGRDRVAAFHTLSGRLEAQRQDDWIVLDFPARSSEMQAAPEGLEAALGVRAVACGLGPGPVGVNAILELGSEAEVRAARPDFRRLRALPVRSVAITAPGAPGGGFDFVSRFFAPAVGVDEDPVTGSAHCLLTPYWSHKLGRARLRAWQASARGGELRLELAGERVKLGGQAVTVFKTELENQD